MLAVFCTTEGTTVTLAIFDLDNTLLGGDSDYLWGKYLVAQDLVDGAHYERENQRFYDDYRAGTLDIYEFLNFALRPLAAIPQPKQQTQHKHNKQEQNTPNKKPAART